MTLREPTGKCEGCGGKGFVGMRDALCRMCGGSGRASLKTEARCSHGNLTEGPNRCTHPDHL